LHCGQATRKTHGRLLVNGFDPALGSSQTAKRAWHDEQLKPKYQLPGFTSPGIFAITSYFA